MDTAIINTLIEYPSVFFGKFIFEPLAGAALAYGLAWLAMRPKDGRKVHNPFLWHSCGVAATVIGSAIFRIIAMITFAGRSAYEPPSAGGVAGFYILIVPAIFAAAYIVWLKKRIVYDSGVVSNTTPQQQSFSVSTKAAPIFSGQRAVQNTPSVSQPAIAARAAPAVTKESAVNHQPPVNSAVAVESSQQPMQEIEDRLYEQIAQEIETNAVDKGIWTKAFSQTGGDDKQTRVLYIKARFDRLMAAENARLEAAQHEREEIARREQEQRARDRDREEVERFELLRKQINVAESTGLDEAKKLAASPEGRDFINWCCWGRIDKVKLAVEKNPLFLAIATRGGTALHWGVTAKQQEVAKFLADKGASVSARNEDGKSPIDIAKESGQVDLAAFLQQFSVESNG